MKNEFCFIILISVIKIMSPLNQPGRENIYYKIKKYYGSRYLGNIFDFQQTKIQCGIFKVNK